MSMIHSSIIPFDPLLTDVLLWTMERTRYACYTINTHSHKWSKVNLKRTQPRSILYMCSLSFLFFFFFFFKFICKKLKVHTMTFPSHQIHKLVQLLKAETRAKPDSPCLTLFNFHPIAELGIYFWRGHI